MYAVGRTKAPVEFGVWTFTLVLADWHCRKEAGVEQGTSQLQQDRERSETVAPSPIAASSVETSAVAPQPEQPFARLTGWSVALQDDQTFAAADLAGDLLVIHGYRGSGKTRFVAALANILAGTDDGSIEPCAPGGRLHLSTPEGSWTVDRTTPDQPPVVVAPELGRVADGEQGLAALLGTPGPFVELRTWRWDHTLALTSPRLLSFLTDTQPAATNGNHQPGATAASALAAATVALELAERELADTELEIQRYAAVPPLADIESAELALVRLREALGLLPHTTRAAETAKLKVSEAVARSGNEPSPRSPVLSVLQPAALLVTAVLVAGAVGLLAAQASTGAALTGLAAMLAAAVALVSPPRQLRADRAAREAERQLGELRSAESRWRKDLGGLQARISTLAATLHLPEQPDLATVVGRAADVGAYRDARRQADQLAVDLISTGSQRQALQRRCRVLESETLLEQAADGARARVQQLAEQLLGFASGGLLTGITRAGGQVILQGPNGVRRPAADVAPGERLLADLCLRVALAVCSVPGIAPLFPLIIDDLVVDAATFDGQGVIQVLRWVTARLQVIALTQDEATAELLAATPNSAVSLLPRRSPRV